VTSELELGRVFKDLTEYREYWTVVLHNGDPLNHVTAELMLEAVEGAQSFEQAMPAIQVALKEANEHVLMVWKQRSAQDLVDIEAILQKHGFHSMSSNRKDVAAVVGKLAKNITFSENDFWQYRTVSDDSLCPLCQTYRNLTFQGHELLTLFPYLEVVDQNTINVNNHMPRDPNCRCRLERTQP
jgi:hypothetical protein